MGFFDSMLLSQGVVRTFLKSHVIVIVLFTAPRPCLVAVHSQGQGLWRKLNSFQIGAACHMSFINPSFPSSFFVGRNQESSMACSADLKSPIEILAIQAMFTFSLLKFDWLEQSCFLLSTDAIGRIPSIWLAKSRFTVLFAKMAASIRVFQKFSGKNSIISEDRACTWVTTKPRDNPRFVDTIRNETDADNFVPRLYLHIDFRSLS